MSSLPSCQQQNALGGVNVLTRSSGSHAEAEDANNPLTTSEFRHQWGTEGKSVLKRPGTGWLKPSGVR